MLAEPQTMPTTREQFAQVSGISVDNISVIRLQMDKLLKEGILIDLVITGESMFARQSDWAEIGIQYGELHTTRLTRGSKHLIAESRLKALRAVTTRMRQWMDRMTNDITGFRPWRYLYYKRYPEWIEKWDELTNQFNAVKGDIIAHYDEDMQSLAADFTAIAERNWKTLSAIGYEEITCEGVGFTDKEAFVEYMVNSVLSKVPPISIIQRDLQADYRASLIQGREQVELEIAQAAVVKAGLEAKQQEAYLQANLLQEQYRHETEMNSLAEQEKRVAIEAMIKAEGEHIRSQFIETVSPIEEVFSQVRNQMAEVCIEAAESFSKNGHLRGKTAEKLRGLVDFYNLIKIEDDANLLQKLQELKSVIGEVGSDRPKTATRPPQDVINALNGVIDLQKTIKADLIAGPSRVSMIG